MEPASYNLFKCAQILFILSACNTSPDREIILELRIVMNHNYDQMSKSEEPAAVWNESRSSGALSTSRFGDFPSEFMIPPLALLDYYPPTLFISHKTPAAFYSSAHSDLLFISQEKYFIRSEIGLGLGF